jgi:hypothetical protein
MHLMPADRQVMFQQPFSDDQQSENPVETSDFLVAIR